jgi:hypothetical protein
MLNRSNYGQGTGLGAPSDKYDYSSSMLAKTAGTKCK